MASSRLAVPVWRRITSSRYTIPALYGLGIIVTFGPLAFFPFSEQMDADIPRFLLLGMLFYLSVQLVILVGLILRGRLFQWLALGTVGFYLTATITAPFTGRSLWDIPHLILDLTLLALLVRALRSKAPQATGGADETVGNFVRLREAAEEASQ